MSLQSIPHLLHVPSAVPIGYGGEARPYAYNAEFFVTKSVYGPPSIMFASAAETPTHHALYWPPVEHQAYNQFLHTVTNAEAPAIPMKGAQRARPGTRVTFKGPNYFVGLAAPSINDVQAFMANRGPQ